MNTFFKDTYQNYPPTEELKPWHLTPEYGVFMPKEDPLVTYMDLIYSAFSQKRIPYPKPRYNHHLRSHQNTLYCNGFPVLQAKEDIQWPALLESHISFSAVRLTQQAMVLHTSAVEWKGRLWMFPGECGSGKSSLALYLCRQGGAYLSDDLLFIDFHSHRVHGFPKAVTLKQGVFPQFPDLTKTYRDTLRGPVRFELPERRVQKKLHLDDFPVVIFPKYMSQKPPKIVEVPPAYAAMCFVQQIYGGLQRDQRTVTLLKKLAEKKIGYVMHYRTFEEAEGLLETLS